jgi:hypothetical protein
LSKAAAGPASTPRDPSPPPSFPQIDPKAVQFEQKVGEGEFGIVYRAQYLGTPVAVKVLKDNNAVALGDFRWGRSGWRGTAGPAFVARPGPVHGALRGAGSPEPLPPPPSPFSRPRTELNVLQKLHHPHCVQFFGAVTKTSPYMMCARPRAEPGASPPSAPNSAPRPRPGAQLSNHRPASPHPHPTHLLTQPPLVRHPLHPPPPTTTSVTEFMGCGSLADIFKDNVSLSTRRCVQLALECARGIAYLHNHHPLSIIHRWAGGGGLGGGAGVGWSGAVWVLAWREARQRSGWGRGSAGAWTPAGLPKPLMPCLPHCAPHPQNHALQRPEARQPDDRRRPH